MSGIAPATPPTASLFLIQKTERLRLAVKEIRGEFAHIEGKIKEVQHDLVLVISALDDLESESHNGVQEPLP